MVISGAVAIRVADQKHLHDRYIVGQIDVYLLSCSLNGVGSKPTTLIQVTGEVAEKVRQTAENLWECAEPVGDPPKADEAVTPDPGDGADN